MCALALRSAGPACRGTSVPDPATCKPVCRAGPAAVAACSLPSTTTGHARDAGRLGRAHPCGTAPSRGLSGQTPDSGAGRPSGRPGGTLQRADHLSSAESSPPLSALRLAWRPWRRSGGIGSEMRLQHQPTPCKTCRSPAKGIPALRRVPAARASNQPSVRKKKDNPERGVALPDEQDQSRRTCSACGPFWPCVMSNSTRWFSSRLR